MAKVDLHLHSNCSDGSDFVGELYKNIKRADVKIFALTDHDTVAGIKEMQSLVNHNEIKFIKGVELTCSADKIKCHILGFGCNEDDEKLLALIEKGKKLRKIKSDTRVKYLKDVWNVELTQEELDWLNSRKSVVKTHFANILVNRGMAEDPVSAMQKYLDQCKCPNTRFSIEEAIEALVNSGAIPVWAHPLGGEGEVHTKFEDFIPKLEYMKNCGIKGIECYYSRYTKEETTFLVDCAKKYGLLISGGSDYHGANKKNINIAKLNVDNEFVDSANLSILQDL